MSKLYKVTLDGILIGTTEFEKADVPMGAVFGVLDLADSRFGYDFFKAYCEQRSIELATDYPDTKMISTMRIPELQITNAKGVEIKGVGNQITGMDDTGYEVSIFGIPYPLYEQEFAQHVKEHRSKVANKSKNWQV